MQFNADLLLLHSKTNEATPLLGGEIVGILYVR